MHGLGLIQIRTATLGEGSLHDLKIGQAAIHGFIASAGLDVGDRTGGIAHLKGIELRAKESAPSRPAIRENGDMGGDLDLGLRQLMANDGADGRMQQRWHGTVAGLDVVDGALVVAFFADHGADQRDVLHDSRGLFQARGEADALDGRIDGPHTAADLCGGMRIEGVELTGPTTQPQKDDRARGLAFGGRLCLDGQQIRERCQPGKTGNSSSFEQGPT